MVRVWKATGKAVVAIFARSMSEACRRNAALCLQAQLAALVNGQEEVGAIFEKASQQELARAEKWQGLVQRLAA